MHPNIFLALIPSCVSGLGIKLVPFVCLCVRALLVETFDVWVYYRSVRREYNVN